MTEKLKSMCTELAVNVIDSEDVTETLHHCWQNDCSYKDCSIHLAMSCLLGLTGEIVFRGETITSQERLDQVWDASVEAYAKRMAT